MQDEAALRERIEKIKLRRRQAEERAFEQKYMRGLSTARSALDPAEDLVLDIEDLKVRPLHMYVDIMKVLPRRSFSRCPWRSSKTVSMYTA